MPRTLTAGQTTEINAATSRFYYLFRLDISPALLLTSCYKDIAYNSETYLSSGFLMDLPLIEDSLNLNVVKIDVDLSSVNQANLAAFLISPPYFKKVELFKFWLSSAGAIIDTPIIRFRGYFNAYDVKENQSKGDSIMRISVVNEFIDFQRRNGRKTNNASQQKYFPTDTGLRHSETVINELTWGKK